MSYSTVTIIIHKPAAPLATVVHFEDGVRSVGTLTAAQAKAARDPALAARSNVKTTDLTRQVQA